MRPFIRSFGLFFGTLLVLLHLHAVAQNVVPNPDFETYTVCPSGFGIGGPLQAVPWQSGSSGSSDYLHECAPPATVGVPINFFGYQPAHSGQGYGGAFARYSEFEYREYLQVKLTEPLDPAFSYLLSMYVNLADLNYCGIAGLGVYFSQTPPPYIGSLPIDVNPQIVFPQIISEEENWVFLSVCYIPNGGEEWITIGNFNNDAETTIDPTCGSLSSYYFFDDVYLEKGGPPGTIDLELGGPVEECGQYTIVPDISGVNFHWEDGSIGPTLTVTESGTYSLTVTSGCSIGIDSIEVEINPLYQVEIVPTSLTLCEGLSYTISFNPSWGDYTWQDGSDDAQYTITTSGLYSVTLDDGCQITTDQILMEFTPLPEPFTLGEDTIICEGNSIVYNFDPGLGDFTWQNNSHNTFFTITDPGIYSLTISNDCGEVEDQIMVEVMDVPEFTLGPDEQNICEGSIIDIELDDDLGTFVWQDGSNENFYSITEPGHYSVTVTNMCGPNSQDIDVSLLLEPFFDLGPDIEVCAGQLPVVFDLSQVNDAEFILWQDGSNDEVYTVHTPGIYRVTVSNDCFTVIDEVGVYVFNVPPLVQLPDDQMLCEGQTMTLTGNGIIGNYLWQDGSTDEEFIVTAPGTYSLTITNECGVGIDQVVIDYIPAISPPDLGADVSLCPGEEYTFYASAQNVNYAWSDGSSADSLIVTTSGTYWLQVSDMCSTAADTVTVVVANNPPVVDLPASLPLCIGQSITIDAGVSAVDYLWSDLSTGSSLTVSAPGTYSLTVSNACGNASDVVEVIDSGLAPFVDLGPDISLCNGDTYLLSPSFTAVDAWQWHDMSVDPQYLINAPGEVYAVVTNQCGVSSDTLQVLPLDDFPAFYLGADTSLCEGDAIVLNININDVNISWQDGSTGNSFTADDAGIYFASVSNSCGTNTDTIQIDFLPSTPTLHLGPDQPLCTGEVIILSPAINGVDYLWSDGSVNNSFTATTPGEYSLTISNDCGSSTDTILIYADNSGPQIDLGADILACEGDVVTVSAGIGGVTYLWNDGSAGPQLIITNSGTYSLTVSNACGSDADTVVVDIQGLLPNPDLGPDTSLCDGNTLLLIVTADAFTNNLWQDLSQGNSFLVQQSGSYSVQQSNHCGSNADTIIVTYADAPMPFDIGRDTLICKGESFVITVPQTGFDISWQDLSTGNTMTINAAQLYSLTLSNECGSQSDQFVVDIDDNTPLFDFDKPVQMCPGDFIELDASQSFAASYQWNNGVTTSSVIITDPGLYTVSVITDCVSVFEEVEVVVSPDCVVLDDLYIPNIFSPNRDGFNDVFSVFPGPELQIEDLVCSVYDRWGNLVFFTKQYPFEWNGTFEGKPLNPGVYVYKIEYRAMAGSKTRDEIFRGDLTLIR